jgi:hydrogenase nickel incorporation protein HypA/HybF
VHEYSIVEALLARVDKEARARGATAVHRLTVRIGELSGVEIDLLAAAFATFRDGTICAEADFDVMPVAAVWTCPACGGPIERGSMLQCRACGVPARLSQGDEILLDRIELEVP